MLLTCATASLYPIRVLAIDGALESTSNTRLRADTILATRLCSGPEPPMIEDIPEGDVSLTWSTSLLRQFDLFCPKNDAMTMSQTERACAAGHLMIWRTIAKMRSLLMSGKKTTTSNPRSSSTNAGIVPSTKDYVDSTDALARAAALYASSFYSHYWPMLSSSITDAKTSRSKQKKGRTLLSNGSSTSTSTPTQIIRKASVIQRNDEDWYLICEDDCIFPPNIGSKPTFAEYVSNLITERAPDDFDICFLHCSVPPNATCTPFSGGLLQNVNYSSLLNCYVLRGKAIEILMAYLPISAPVDLFIGELLYDGILKGYAVVESTVRIADTKSVGASNINHSGRSIPGKWPNTQGRRTNNKSNRTWVRGTTGKVANQQTSAVNAKKRVRTSSSAASKKT